MKLLVDMNLSPRWVGLLADAGIEAVHWLGIGAKNAPDSEIMIYAGANGYVVLTVDPNRTRLRVLPLRPKESW